MESDLTHGKASDETLSPANIQYLGTGTRIRRHIFGLRISNVGIPTRILNLSGRSRVSCHKLHVFTQYLSIGKFTRM